jgi:hypothetical protein
VCLRRPTPVPEHSGGVHHAGRIMKPCPKGIQPTDEEEPTS